jgi:hypothetical protein
MSANIRRVGSSVSEASPSFLRKAKNFMSNWEVSGGSFSFDGYRVRLRIPTTTSSLTPSPWQTTRNDDGDTKRVSVRPGTINSIVPTDIFDPIEITGTVTEYIVLTMTSTAGSPVSASLSKETTYPVPSATTPSHPPTEVKDVIAVIGNGVVYQVRDTNLVATSVEVYQETVANPAVGERQYIPWYRWEITSSD